MDYPKSVPGVGLVGGKFADENTTTGQQGSLIPSEWGNAVTDELLNILQAAGVAPDEAVKDQIAKALFRDPTDLRRGLPMVATQAEADALADDSKMLTPFKAGKALAGRLIGVRYFSAPGVSIYAPTAGTKKIVVEVQGGGGAGGGAYYTLAGQLSAGGGGGSGAYGRALISAGFSGVSVTPGLGGTGGVAVVGGNGGASSFGALVSAPGGIGGAAFPGVSTFPSYVGGGGGGARATGGDINSGGTAGGMHIFTASDNAFGGDGAPSYFSGGGARAGNGSGFSGSAPGAGGGGACRPQNSGSGAAGGNGAAGVVIVWEYA